MSNILSQRYNLDNFEATFRNYLISERVSPVTLKNYLSDIRHFFGWFSLFVEAKDAYGSLTSDQNTIALFLNNQAVEQYKAYLLENNLPTKTVNRRLSTLRKFCTFAISQGWIKENVAKNVGNVGSSVISNEVRNPAIRQLAESVPIKNADRNDMLGEFKKYIASQQSNITGRDVINHVSTKDVDLIVNDVHEFLTFINS